LHVFEPGATHDDERDPTDDADEMVMMIAKGWLMCSATQYMKYPKRKRRSC
jgi:hypothetical protein